MVRHPVTHKPFAKTSAGVCVRLSVLNAYRISIESIYCLKASVKSPQLLRCYLTQPREMFKWQFLSTRAHSQQRRAMCDKLNISVCFKPEKTKLSRISSASYFSNCLWESSQHACAPDVAPAVQLLKNHTCVLGVGLVNDPQKKCIF